MALDAKGYYQYLRSYLNMAYYAIEMNIHNELHLKEKIYINKGDVEIKVMFNIDGDAFAIKLDKEVRKGEKLPLYHFLNNQGKPWSKSCDFVIFYLRHNRILLYCLEFKYTSLSADSVIAQLKSSENWCKSLYSVINIYTGKRKRLNLTKYVLSLCEEPSKYLDSSNKYLAGDPSIRHYHYDEINGIDLHSLEHSTVEAIG